MKYIELKPHRDETRHIIIFHKGYLHNEIYLKIHAMHKCYPISAGFVNREEGEPIRFHGFSESLNLRADGSLKLNSSDMWRVILPGYRAVCYGTKECLDTFFPDSEKVPCPDFTTPHS